MELEISYNSYLIRKFTKISSEKVSLKENSSIADLLDYLKIKYGEPFIAQIIDNGSGKLKMLLLVNGTRAAGPQMVLCDNDRINMLSFTTGG